MDKILNVYILKYKIKAILTSYFSHQHLFHFFLNDQFWLARLSPLSAS